MQTLALRLRTFFVSHSPAAAQSALQKAPLVLLLPRSGRVSRHLACWNAGLSVYVKLNFPESTGGHEMRSCLLAATAP